MKNSLDIGTIVGEEPRGIESAMRKITASFNTYINQGSGYTFRKVLSHTFKITKYSPLGSGIPMVSPFATGNPTSMGRSYIETPEKRKGKNTGLINICNDDNECFRWCHARHIRYKRGETIRNPHRITDKDRNVAMIELDYTGICFPITNEDIPIIEELNNIIVHVFSYHYDTDEVSVIYAPPPDGTKDVLRLLLLEAGDRKHFLLMILVTAR